MNYDLNEEQQILKNSAHNFFAKECPSTYVRAMIDDPKGYLPEIWSKMAELGWLGLMFPEQLGGSEGSFLDLAVLLYEMGYACFPGPFFSTAVLGGLTLLEWGSEEQKKRYLPGVARGEQILTLAWTEKNGTYYADGINLKAERKDNNFILTGAKLFVPYAHIADTLICAVKTSASQEKAEHGISLFLIGSKSEGISVDLLKTMAGDKQCEITFDKVKVPEENILGVLNKGWSILQELLQKAAVAKCCEMSGGAQKVIELVIPHVKERKQFGHPIGSFQAVQHRCADILTYVDTCRFITYQAAWRISQGLPYEKEAAMCKTWVSDSYRRLVALGHQVMGGMGFMEEHDLQLYFKHAKISELAFGDADFHRETVAHQLGL